jgi:hypothetical protein
MYVYRPPLSLLGNGSVNAFPGSTNRHASTEESLDFLFSIYFMYEHLILKEISGSKGAVSDFTPYVYMSRTIAYSSES